MSREIVHEVNQKYPEYLQQNVGESCHWFTQRLIEHLRAAGHQAFLMCKTRGEGQYVPRGFVPRDVIGLDGKTYTCTGVSHDAIWCDGKQYDTIGSANDNDEPIYGKSTDPFWSFNPADGPKIVGSPVWNAVPPEFWRSNNPPLKLEPIISPPLPPLPPLPPKPSAFPSYEDLGGDAFFRAMIGVPLQADMLMAGQQLNDGSSVWFSRLTYRLMRAFLQANGQPVDAAGEVRIVRNEWRSLLGLPQL